ncbi:MAG: hypothetical protein JF612_10130 [Planctomycetia bacterium]|jgi:hypothetical protein|nr:hypothetical protein [Planctomycetia bacterium]
MQAEVIEALSSDGSRLRLEFLWNGDRYGQRISLIDSAGAAQPLLESIEGAATDDWPLSPPLQTLTIEARGDNCHVALLVGMAGGAHWSASIEPTPGKDQLLFDIACRHSANPGHLGNRYRRLADSTNQLAIDGDSARVSWKEDLVDIQPMNLAVLGTSRWRFALTREH